MELFEIFLKHFWFAWKDSYFSKPILETSCLLVIITSYRTRRNTPLKRTALLFCFGFFILFFSADLLYSVYTTFRPTFDIVSYIKVYEILNSFFPFIEGITVIGLANYELRNRSLVKASWLLGLVIITLNILFYYFIYHETGFQQVESVGELVSGICYAALTLYLSAYNYILYKNNITCTFVTPTLYCFFCYVVVSLLLFPCSAFFRFSGYEHIAMLLNAYHCWLIITICWVLLYNVVKHPNSGVQYLKFEI